ncbi:MAG TPA: O-antigen ligase family protein [Solirubrobacteraceae bacterium]|nr:O-antigen ligase family protein [Solirubrobacteraceae bacterium]
MAGTNGTATLQRIFSPREVDSQTVVVVLAAVFAFGLIGIPAGVNPVAVIGAAAAAVFVALILSDVTVGLLCFGLVAFFEDLPGVSGTVSAAKVAGVLVALSWLATLAIRSSVRRGFVGRHPTLSFAAVLFVAWSVISLAWAKEPSVGITAISRYGLNLLLLPIVYAAIRNRRHVHWLVGILVAGATLSALYGMVLARGSALAEGTSRLSGAGQDANYLAALLVSGIVLAVALVSIRTLPSRIRVLALAAVLIMLVGLIDTVSRSGMVGLGAALVAGIVFAGRGRRFVFVAVSAAIALSVVAYYVSVASPAARARITTVQGGSGRTDIWTVGWRMVKAHPINGIGVGNFPDTTIDYLLQPGSLDSSLFIVDKPQVAHNIYLEVLAETGVVGLVLFLSIIGFLLWCALEAARIFAKAGDRAMDILSRAIVVATVGVLATDFFISDQYSKSLWLQLALGPALLAVAKREAGGRFRIGSTRTS